jgi:hypothetical protein
MFAGEDSRVAEEKPHQRPEGKLIADAMIRDGRSVRDIAANAGISDTRLRHIANGYQPLGQGRFNPIVAPAGTLAKIADALGLAPEHLAAADRGDAAEELRRLRAAPIGVPGGADRAIEKVLERGDVPEVEKKRIVQELIRLREQDAQRREEYADNLLATWDRARGA